MLQPFDFTGFLHEGAPFFVKKMRQRRNMSGEFISGSG